MILQVLRSMREAGVLGMNRRNAEYIMNWNARSLFPLVDDKFITKQLAMKHSVPTPTLYYLIEGHGDVARLESKVENHKEFVVKPARGSGGSGIVLISDRHASGFVKQDGTVIHREDLSYHIFGILSGIHSLEGLEDRAMIEELLHPDPIFSAITFRGVPDIRILVYRGVPAMAMVRLPTRASDGKANLHRGAIGVGIDIARGATLEGVHGESVVSRHPDTGNPLAGIEVPHWDKMLLFAAEALEMTRLGYLGVDLVIDREKGPMLLEMNARPGLRIQIANRAGLRHRLDLIDRAPPEVFEKPADRVAWAKEAFRDGVVKS